MSDEPNQHQGPQWVVREFEKRKRTLPVWECPGSTYHVRASILRGRPERLVQSEIGEIVQKSLHYDDDDRYTLHCYALMPDHFHLILHPSRRDNGSVPLSEIMQAIKGATSHRIGKLSGRTGSFWLEENYTRMIRCPVEYQWTWHYIRCNPIVAGFVERPDQWPWWWSRR